MKKNLYLFLLMAFAAGACKKQTATVDSLPLNDYYPLQVGKFIRYQLDSTLYINFGQRDTIVSYDAKDVVDAEITDNQGRPGYRVIRYLRSLNSTNEADYRPALTYLVTPTREQVDVMEDNLRYQKLRLPVTQGFTWKGNAYLPATPFYGLYEFSNDEDMDLWDYSYQQANESVELGGNVYDNTVSVLQVADSANVPIEFPEGLAYRNYWMEQYAKGIGLVYKEVVMWEYQPPNSGSPGFVSGFGLKMTITDHN